MFCIKMYPLPAHLSTRTGVGVCWKAAECGSTGSYGFMEQHVSNEETDEVSGRQKEGRKMNRGVLACWREQVQMALRVPSISNHSMIS